MVNAFELKMLFFFFSSKVDLEVSDHHMTINLKVAGINGQFSMFYLNYCIIYHSGYVIFQVTFFPNMYTKTVSVINELSLWIIFSTNQMLIKLLNSFNSFKNTVHLSIGHFKHISFKINIKWFTISLVISPKWPETSICKALMKLINMCLEAECICF